MEKVTDLTARLAAPIVEEQGCSLWDVEYVKEAGTWYLRVLIDKEGGVVFSGTEEADLKGLEFSDTNGSVQRFPRGRI